MQNELRKRNDSESWSVISEIIPSTVGCALCPGSEEKQEVTFKIEDKKGAWLAKSMVDPYPITHPTIFKPKETNGLSDSFSAHGWSEIIIETRDHTKELHELSTEEIKNVLMVYVDRINSLKEKEGVAQIHILKDNLQVEFQHAYSRILTLPVIPKKIGEKLQKFNDYQFKHESCIYCDLIKKEARGSRVIFENEHFIALTPFSEELPSEVLIFPKKHYAALEGLNDFEVFTLAETIKNILTRLSVALKPFKYSMSFMLKPVKEKDFHFHITIAQKTIPTTFEEASGIHLSKTSPESTAKILRG